MPSAGEHSPIDEQACVRRAQAGDVAAFGDLVRDHQTAIFNVCYRLMGERREAEDLTQDAFIRAFDKLHLLDPARPFLPWMRRLATNVCLNALQRNRRIQFSLDGDDIAEPRADTASEPPAAFAQREAADGLRRALRTLPAHYRAVIELIHFQEMTYADAAEALRIPVSDVKSHLFRARKRLLHSLEDDR
jgi:RNA polymerase sigma-70 factor (ECF subfamily)